MLGRDVAALPGVPATILLGTDPEGIFHDGLARRERARRKSWLPGWAASLSRRKSPWPSWNWAAPATWWAFCAT
jgi:hypothetical protein